MTTTASPLDDPKVREATMKAVRNQYGEDAAGELFTGSGKDGEENLDKDIDIVDYKVGLNFDNHIKALLDTSHLKNFERFDKYLGLDGESYAAYKKCLWYLAQSLKQPTKAYKINYKTKIDNRINILAITPPASGKTTSKNKIRRLVDQDDVIETSGLCHPQQLIGKTIPATTRKPKRDIPGLLTYKLLMHDEVQDFLNEKNDLYSASQKLKRQAMDVYGDNEISKKLVSNDAGEETKCVSPTRFLDFAHPKRLESPFFDTGSFRRYFIFDLQADDTIDLKALTDFQLDGDFKYDNFPIVLNEDCKNNKYDSEFNQETLDIIAHCHATIFKFLINHKNENAFRFGMLMRYNFRSLISKIVYILALANNEKVPSLRTTIMGCRDAILFILETIKAINSRANIGISSDVWGGLNENDAIALTWLFRKKCISPDKTDVTIKKFWTVLAHIYGCKVSQSRSHFYRLKKDGYIDSSQVGKTSSKVWLKYLPKEFKVVDNDAASLDFLDAKFKGAGAKIPLLTPLRELYVDDKEFEKAKGDGGAGLMGYILFIICVEVYDIYYIKNIYRIGVPTPSPLTPLNSEEVVTTIDNEIKGAKTPENALTPLNEKPVPEAVEQHTQEAAAEPESERDTQYFEAKECKKIKDDCTKEAVLDYLKSNSQANTQQLLKHFGPGVLKFKREGLFK